MSGPSRMETALIDDLALPGEPEAGRVSLRQPLRAETPFHRDWGRILIVLLAAGLRLYALDWRPPHFDEGVNGFFTDQMQHSGFYRYDPTNYHGPLHFYALFVFKCLLGRNLWALRLPVALIGILTVDWVFRFERFFGRGVCVWTALAMTFSPALMFFQRYAIHETWLAFFLILGFWGLVGLWRDGRPKYLWAAGMALTGMMLTKETYVIHLAALALAAAVMILAEAVSRKRVPFAQEMAPQQWVWRDGAAVVAVSTALVVAFYSGFGFNFPGLKGLVTAFQPWAHKATAGEGHNKPFVYWTETLFRNEPWAFAGLLLSLRFFVGAGPGGRPMRLLALYAPCALLAYSFIPYKTPWCMTSIAWPFLFVGAAVVTETPRRFVLPANYIAAGLLVFSGFLALRLNFWRYADDGEAYVYVHTYEQVNEITGPLYDLARLNPSTYHLRGLVLSKSSHPLPWLLGDFSRVGYYAEGHQGKPGYRLPDDFNADFLIVQADWIDIVRKRLTDDYFESEFRLRPGLGAVTLFLRASVFRVLMPERQAEVHAGAEQAPTEE